MANRGRSLYVIKIFNATTYLTSTDGDEEDTLITNFISTAQEISEDILRYPLSEFEEIPAVVRQALLYCIANMYEKREGTHYYMKNDSGGMAETVNVMKLILANLRQESW